MPDRGPQFETRWRPLGSAVPSLGDQAPRPGELRFATAIPPAVVPEPSSSRLVLVMEVDSADGTALVMLTTNEIEMACDQDFVLPAEQIDLPFPISVQSDLVGAVWISQLENPIASVPHETLRALVAFRHGAPAADLLPCQGLPVDGPHDPRWQFKLQELWAIQALSASCTSHVLEERVERTLSDTMAEFFATQEPRSPRDVAAALGLPEPRVSRATASLVEQGFLIPDHEDPEALRLNEDRPCAIGVSIRRRRDQDFELIGVLTNLKAVDVRRRTERRTITSSDVRSVVDGIRSIVDVLLQADASEPERVIGLGVELAGHINGETGEVVFSPDLRGIGGSYWRNVPLSELLWDATGLETVVQNDANALAIHEQWFGEGFGTDDFAVVLVGGKGVGSGLVSGGRLIRGSDGIAGEIGHLLMELPGLPCRCGNRGCLETIASEEAICEAIGRQTDSEPPSITVAAQLAQDNNEAAVTAFYRAGTMLGRALSIVLNLLNPSRVILFAIPEMTDPSRYPASAGRFLDGLDEAVRTSSFSFAADQVKLIPRTVSRRTIDDELGARGAAAALLARMIMWSANGDQEGDGMIRTQSRAEMLSPIASRS